MGISVYGRARNVWTENASPKFISLMSSLHHCVYDVGTRRWSKDFFLSILKFPFMLVSWFYAKVTFFVLFFNRKNLYYLWSRTIFLNEEFCIIVKGLLATLMQGGLWKCETLFYKLSNFNDFLENLFFDSPKNARRNSSIDLVFAKEIAKTNINKCIEGWSCSSKHTAWII